MRLIQWHLLTNGEYLVTRKGDPRSQITPTPSKVVATGTQCASRPAITPFLMLCKFLLTQKGETLT